MAIVEKTRSASTGIPLLQPGDVLSRTEFARPYDAMPEPKKADLRAGVLDYLVWISDENRLVWWHLLDGEYAEISAGPVGLLGSLQFPGLTIDSPALLSGDLSATLGRFH